jgi:hypothetical protein
VIDRADGGVGASRQNCRDDEHQGEMAHSGNLAARARQVTTQGRDHPEAFVAGGWLLQ